MADLQSFKCPNCGGAVQFDSGLQKLKCPYCDSELVISDVLDYETSCKKDGQDRFDWEKNAAPDWTPGEADRLHSYVCQSCGGEIVGDETVAAMTCPICDNPVVMTQKVTGTLRPEYVIPFKLDKAAAKEALRRHYEKKRLLPKVFKEENHIDEIRGVYVPFWLFDADADADLRYRATRVRSWSDSNYIYTETQYYALLRAGNIGFDKVPADGSTKMPDDLMESIEPFDYSEAVDFNTAYLAGYLANKYDVTAEQSAERANNRIRRSTEKAFASTISGYSSVVPEGGNIQLANGKSHYALLPVWLLNTTWNGQKYTFAMNGQTGKFVGNLPMDKGAYTRWLLGLLGVFSAAALAVCWLWWMLTGG